MKKYSIVLLMAMSFSACSLSPEAAGKKIGKQYCDCDFDAEKELHQELLKYYNAFEDYGFKTRISARSKVAELTQHAAAKKNICEQETNLAYNQAKMKYANDSRKLAEFELALTIAKSASGRSDVHDNRFILTQINQRILSIIPPTPDLEKLKEDLIGRRLSEQQGGYFGDNWYWEITSKNELKSVEVRSKSRQDEDYIYKVHLLLQGEANQYEADIIVTYALRQNDDWIIDFIETKDIHIVKTGKYDNCITAQRKQVGALEYQLEFTNHCDVPLLIGGIALNAWGDKKWRKFTTTVDGNSIKSIGGIFSVSVQDYRIDFIERP
jgi:hypothetical protein